MNNTHRTILLDCDGVLTDGRLHIDASGFKMFKSFHTRDVRAIRELVYRGFEVVIVSVDDWEGITAFANKVGAEVHFTRDKGNLPFSNFIAVGDDAWDVPMLRNAVQAFAPSTADQSVFSAVPNCISLCRGGEGVVAALLRYLIEHPNES